MEKKLSFNEVLPMEELAPVELNSIQIPSKNLSLCSVCQPTKENCAPIVGLAIYARVVLGNFFMIKKTNAI